jgi:NAD(P)H-hydrate epimerase
MANELLTVSEMVAADAFATANGVPSLTLMENAGRAVAREIAARFSPRRTLVLCGPGNNGGDGYVAARHLKALGFETTVGQLGARDVLKGDADQMARRWDGPTEPLAPDRLDGAELFVDALFGAGLSRPLDGLAREVALRLNQLSAPIVAIDVPSGIQGDSPHPLGNVAIDADLTVTFFRKKLAHVLVPSRLYCGETVVADIGIPPSALAQIAAKAFENGPELWSFPIPAPEAHKYARGHCVVVSGPAHATGAARLAAAGALRVGAGLVSVASPIEAVAVNAAHLTAIMVKPFAGTAGLRKLLSDKRLNAVVVGPGLGVGNHTREIIHVCLEGQRAVVLDADALTSFGEEPQSLFAELREPAVLTPHEGEFERLFPGLLDRSSNRIEAVRVAAGRAGVSVLLKGPDTVIASPDGRAIVNTNAPAWLATAGSGDVLSGIVAGLMAQGVDSFKAAATAAWVHAEAARSFGPGLISEDIPEHLPTVISRLVGTGGAML